MDDYILTKFGMMTKIGPVLGLPYQPIKIQNFENPFSAILKTVKSFVFIHAHTHTHTHTHAHTFKGPFSGTTRLSRYQKGKTNLDFTEARDSEWQLHQLGHMQVCTGPALGNWRP